MINRFSTGTFIRKCYARKHVSITNEAYNLINRAVKNDYVKLGLTVGKLINAYVDGKRYGAEFEIIETTEEIVLCVKGEN